MTVRLLAPWGGIVAGGLYTGSDESYLLDSGRADNELGRGQQFTTSQTTHVLSLSDAFRERNFTAATTVTVRVPAVLVAQAQFGIIATFRQSGVGQIVFAPDSGVTVNAPANLVAKSAGVGSVIQVEKTDVQTLYVFGSLATS